MASNYFHHRYHTATNIENKEDLHQILGHKTLNDLEPKTKKKHIERVSQPNPIIMSGSDNNEK
jgi:hypothetical protein